MMDQKITLFRFAKKFLSRTISLLFYLSGIRVLAQPVIMDFGMCGESMSFSLIVMIPLPMITCLH